MYGLIADPAAVRSELVALQGVLPEEAWSAINAQVLALTRQTTASLSLASIVSLILAFVNARLGAYSMMGALNVVYKRNETRSIALINSTAVLFTVGALAVFVFNVYAVVAVPRLLASLGFPQLAESAMHTFRWPVLALMMAFSLALIYRFGPARRTGHWHWLSIGSLIATILWLISSAAFSWYVAKFNSYDRLYGSFGALVILLYWLWLTAFVALLGAEVDMLFQTKWPRHKTVAPIVSAA